MKADISEFGLDELDEYNDMIKCLSNFKEDFVECNRDIKRLGQMVFNIFPENSTIGSIVKCCGIWQLRDCWKKKAVDKCPKDQLLVIHRMPNKLLPMLHDWCFDYSDDSIACKLPYILPICLIVIVVIIISIIVLCVLRRLKKRRTSTKYTSANGSHNTNNNDLTDTEV